VALEAYSGPLDLLLYLIRKHEVDIYDIPVAVVAEQYQAYLDLMAEINVNVAGEFLVMAATLMEIKSRMLLPTEKEGDDEEEDPRAELVRQLLEYKRYKDLARELGTRAAEQSLKFPRPETAPTAAEATEEGAPEGTGDAFLDGVGLWELIDAFAKVVGETRFTAPETRVLERERPIHEYRRELLQLVTERRQVEFSEVFATCRTRDDMIAMFMALLELVRLRRLGLHQAGAFTEIHVHLAADREAAQAQAKQVRAERPKQEGTAEGPADGAVPVRPREDVLEELVDEGESLGRARKRIDAALARAEAFLKEHHRRRREEAPEGAEKDAPSDPDEGSEEGGTDA
jgi:segregation and condensation protein A